MPCPRQHRLNPDSAVPPLTPAHVTANGGLSTIVVAWDAPGYPNHAYAEVWRSGTSSLSDAVLTGTATGMLYTDSVEPNSSYWYWVRFVSTFPVTGPYNGTVGTHATTGMDPAAAINLLTGNPSSPSYGQFPFVVLATPVTINGVVVPAGTYMKDGYIQNGTITNAKIGNAAIDDAKIANLNASKITAGDIDAARMSANIVTAVTGKFTYLSAVASKLGTVEIDSTGFLRTTDAVSYGSGIGIWMGYSGGAYKWRVGDPAGHIIKWDGGTLTIKGTLSGADGTFSGSLSAATGTFAGSLSAATGTFAGALSAATGSFAGSLSAASGTFAGSLTAGAVNAVNTINIAGQAVTIPASAFQATHINLNFGTYDCLALSLASTGAPITIWFGGSFLAGASDASGGGGGIVVGEAVVRLVRNNSVTISTINMGDGGNGMFAYQETPGAGVQRYDIYFDNIDSQGASQSSTGSIANLCLVAMETKR
jgi:hypothetical protein